MNIQDYALAVLAMEPSKRIEAVEKLKFGIEHEKSWNSNHRTEVLRLISFLQSNSKDIADLETNNFLPA